MQKQRSRVRVPLACLYPFSSLKSNNTANSDLGLFLLDFFESVGLIHIGTAQAIDYPAPNFFGMCSVSNDIVRPKKTSSNIFVRGKFKQQHIYFSELRARYYIKSVFRWYLIVVMEFSTWTRQAHTFSKIPSANPQPSDKRSVHLIIRMSQTGQTFKLRGWLNCQIQCNPLRYMFMFPWEGYIHVITNLQRKSCGSRHASMSEVNQLQGEAKSGTEITVPK